MSKAYLELDSRAKCVFEYTVKAGISPVAMFAESFSGYKVARSSSTSQSSRNMGSVKVQLVTSSSICHDAVDALVLGMTIQQASGLLAKPCHSEENTE